MQSSVVRMLGMMLDNDVNEMLVAGNLNGAIRHLGGDIEEGNIVEVVLSKKLDELQRSQDHLRDAKKNWEKKNSKEHKENLDKWEKKVEEINEAIKTIKQRFNNALEDDCIICQSKLTEPIMVKCCQNMYCKQCISHLIKSKRHTDVPCPMCRSILKDDSVIKITGYGDMENNKREKKRPIIFERDETDEIDWEEHKAMTKPDTIEYILKKNPKGKFIIFSNHDASFSLIKNKLDEIDIKSVEIKGTKESKEKKLHSYTHGNTNVIFLNARFNGAGINLQMTSDIILYHDMPQHLMTQIIGRANRIGREKQLTIHLLI
jgi:hypothetical protein